MNIGITLMTVGMVTVFAVLIIIINLSKLLIAIVNKIAPEEAVTKKAAPAAAIPGDVTQVINQVISKITKGKGSVVSISRID